MSLSVGGVSTNELLVGAAVIGGAYLLYQFKGASDDLAAVEDDEGCPELSASSVAGMLMEPWAYTKCAANKISDIPFAQVASDAGDAIADTAVNATEQVQAAFGYPTAFTANVAIEANKSSDFDAWVAYANQLQKNNPQAVANTTVDPYGCMDTRWLPPFPGNPVTVAKVCNDNSGCYAEAFYKVGGNTPFGDELQKGTAACAVAADNGVLAELDYDAVKADPLAIPLPSDSPQSLQSAGFGVSFENAANLLNKGYKMPAKGKVPGSAMITVGNINALYSSNPMDNPSMPVPPGGWK